MNIKRSITSLAVFGVFVLLSSCGSPSILVGTISVGVAEDAPGFAVGSTRPTGMDINVMTAIGQKLKLPMASRPITSADREPSLKKKTATLVIHTFSISVDRNHKGIDFAGPYMISTQALLVRSDNKTINATKPQSLKGRSICTVATTTGGEVTIPGAVMGKAGTIQSTTRECVDAVQEGRNDAFFTDTLLLYGYVHANAGKFNIIFPGTFGQKQYYGVGLLEGHHDDCLEINEAIRTYLQTQWRTDFLSTLPDAAKDFPGNNQVTGDFESTFKPTDTDMERLSCKL